MVQNIGQWYAITPIQVHSGVSLVAFHWVANILYNGFSRSHNANQALSYTFPTELFYSIPLLNA